MRNLRVAVLVSLLVVLAAACGTQSTGQGAGGTNSGTTQAEKPLTGSAEDFGRARFDDPTRIDNKWFPLTPGTRFIYEGSSIVDDGLREEHSIVVNVTDLTKVIDGVRTLIVYDEDCHAGQLLEPEVRFHAQDNAGNVWYFGEYREDYEDGELEEPRAWVPDQKGARAGISMPANPRKDAPGYAQGFAPPPVNWVDRARVYKMGQKTCVPVGCYENTLINDEFERSKPGSYQLKYYAPGVGNVRVGWRGTKEEEKETLELVEYKRLSPEALAKVRKTAMALDRRGYDPGQVGDFWRYTREVYSHTQPAKHTLKASQ
ncbi:MAG: hypothetical protein ACR2GU_05200 [Rubrobacteraceae bacterium]